MYWPDGPESSLEVVLEQADDRAERVHHQPLADQPEELARPSGRAGADSSSSRGVPMPLARSTVTAARCSCSTAVAVDVTAPATRPLPSTVIRVTRAPVTSSTPSSIASGQCVMSALAFAPSGHAGQAGARYTQALTMP